MAEERWDAICELVARLEDIGMLDSSYKDEVLGLLRERENQISTGIGSGVAIPHAFSEQVDKVVAVFGRSLAGVEFDAHDDAPVKFILLFVVPKKNYHLHLQTLAAIAKMFTNCETRRQLELAESEAEVLSIFDSRPSRYTNEVTQRLY